jgi:imidazolonepropionase-like amidohydrolase
VLVLAGLRAPGGDAVELRIEGGRIVAFGPAVDRAGAALRDGGGRTVVPAFIDSHVHLAYLPTADALARGGVAAAVDLAAPLDAIGDDAGPLEVRWAGPMLTVTGGYPTTSWGAAGYGIAVDDPAGAAEAVGRVVAAGATVVKVPLTGTPSLSTETLEAVVAAAHARGLPVVAHAMTDAEVLRAAAAGVDGLAHTPTAPLGDAAVAAWSGRFVISTLAAFGGGANAVDNLRRLRGAGAQVLYGTDHGNLSAAGIVSAELDLLGAAGLDGAAILEAGTAAPAAVWGFPGRGALRPGGPADFLLLEGDPWEDPARLAAPREVWLAGQPLD